MPVIRRAGDRRHLVALQEVTGRTASGDGYTETWETYAETWASVRPATATLLERSIAATVQAPVTHLVELDYQPTLSHAHRVLVGGTLSASDTATRKLYIRGAQNVEERNKTHVLACEERAS